MVDAAGETQPSSIWGVITDEKQNIYASDLTQGLWVLREPMAVPTAVPTAVAPTATTRPPTAVPPTAMPPTAIPQTGRVCPQIMGRVPEQAINVALANPTSVNGYNLPQRPSLPVGPSNPLRTWLTVLTLAKPYHPTANSLVYRASCP